MKKVISYCCIVMIVLSSSCKRQALRPYDYVKYIKSQESGLQRAVHVDGWEYDITYKPAEYILLTEAKGDRSFDQNKRERELRGTAWFNISFKRADGQVSPLRYNAGTLDEYNRRLDYFLNHASGNIYLIYGTDTLKPMSYLFETNYNLAPQETMVVGFSLPGNEERPSKNMELKYYDDIFRNGVIKTTYPAETLNDIPKLIL